MKNILVVEIAYLVKANRISKKMKNLPLLPQRERTKKNQPAAGAKEGIAVDIQKEQQQQLYYPPIQSIRTNQYIHIESSQSIQSHIVLLIN